MIKIDKANATPLDLTIISSIQDCQTRNIKFNNITFDADTITDRVGTVFERRKKGKWQWSEDMMCFICSECKSGWKEQPTLMGKPLYEWCPVCGADMRGDADEVC